MIAANPLLVPALISRLSSSFLLSFLSACFYHSARLAHFLKSSNKTLNGKKLSGVDRRLEE